MNTTNEFPDLNKVQQEQAAIEKQKKELATAEAAIVDTYRRAFTGALGTLAKVYKNAPDHVRASVFHPKKGDKEVSVNDGTLADHLKTLGLTARQIASHVGGGGGRRDLTVEEVMAFFDKQEAGKRFQQQVVCNALGRSGTTVLKKLEKLREAKKIDFEEKGTSKLWFKR